MNKSLNRLITILVALMILVIIIVAMGPFYMLQEGEQAVVTRFGEIVDTEHEAGLQFKMPVVDKVVKYSEKILSWDGDPQRVPTQEQQFILVDTTARWKITDPAKFYESVSNMNQAYSRLDDVIDSSVRRVIAQYPLNESVRDTNIINDILRNESGTSGAEIEEMESLKNLLDSNTIYDEIAVGRRQLSQKMMEISQVITPQYGIELIDVVIRQIRYSDDLTQSVYDRMIKERNQIAQAYRSYGEGKKAEWMGKMDKDQREILSYAYSESETIKGDADAKAAAIFSGAYEADPEFYTFWRAIESYRKVLPTLNKTLTSDMDYFDYLYERNQ